MADLTFIVTQEDLDPNRLPAASRLRFRELQTQVAATLEFATTFETSATVFVEAFTATVLLTTVVVFVGTPVAAATLAVPRQAHPALPKNLSSRAPAEVDVVPIYAAWFTCSHLVPSRATKVILAAIATAVVTKGMATTVFAPKVATGGIATELTSLSTAASPTAADATLVQHVAGKVPVGVVTLVVMVASNTTSTASVNRDGVSIV